MPDKERTSGTATADSTAKHEELSRPVLARGLLRRLIDTWEVFIRTLPWIVAVSVVVWTPANYGLNRIMEMLGYDPADLGTLLGAMPLFTLQELLVDPLWMSLVLGIVFVRVGPRKENHGRHWMVHALRRWPVMWGVILVTRPMIGIGALLILPGLLFLVRYFFVEYTVAWEGNSVGRSLKRSRRLAIPFSSTIFLHGLAVGGATVLGTMTSYAILFESFDDSYGWALALTDSWGNVCWAFPVIYFGLFFLDAAHAVDADTFAAWPAPMGTAPRERKHEELAPAWSVRQDMSNLHAPEPRRPRWVAPTFAIASLAAFLWVPIAGIGLYVYATTPEGYFLGADYFEREEYEAAIPPLRQAAAQSDESDIQYMLGISLYMTERYGEGILHLERALAENPEDAVLHYYIGLSQLETAESQSAVVHLRKAYELDPQDADYAVMYIGALDAVGDGAGMLEVLDDLPEEVRHTSRFRLFRAMALRLLERRVEALELARSLREAKDLTHAEQEIVDEILGD